MDRMGDMYLQVETVFSDVITSGPKSAGNFEEKSRSTSFHGQVQRTTSKMNSKGRVRPSPQDFWEPSERKPRLIGMFVFVLSILGILVQLGLCVEFHEIYAGGDSGVHMPMHIGLSDTLKKGPTHWTGLGFVVATSGLLIAIGCFRHRRISKIADPLFPRIAVKVFLADVFGVAGCFFAVLACVFPAGRDGGLQSKVLFGCWMISLLSIGAYAFIQVVQLEYILVSHGLIRGRVRRVRILLMVVTGAFVLISILLLFSRDTYSSDSEEEAHPDRHHIWGCVLLLSQGGAVIGFTALVGMTDYASVEYNAEQLQELSLVWQKSRKPIQIVINEATAVENIFDEV